nr:hypothetical protein [Bacillus pumilus]
MKKWFLQVFLTALITMWIQAGLDQANIIHITNVWIDAEESDPDLLCHLRTF